MATASQKPISCALLLLPFVAVRAAAEARPAHLQPRRRLRPNDPTVGYYGGRRAGANELVATVSTIAAMKRILRPPIADLLYEPTP